MANSSLRIGQFDTVLYNANLNPMGVPESVKKILSESISRIGRYPADYYPGLKKAISAYTGCDEKHVVLGSGSTDLIRLFISLVSPKKALLPTPSATEYESSLSIYGCDTDYYELSEEADYRLDVSDFISRLDSSYDMVILGNPNNPTSQIILREDIKSIADACKEHDIFLLIDEMYIEFTENYRELTSTALLSSYDNIAVLRSISKFFAVPGLRVSYGFVANDDLLNMVNIISTPNSISTLTAIACTELLKDKAYIEESGSQIFTERNLIYSAMATNKNVRLFKPYANFMLIKILKDDVTAGRLAEACNLKGMVIQKCDDFRGLDEKYVRFCFMKPAQNDLLVNTMLELLS